MIKVQTMNRKVEVITIRTPGYFNPNQCVRLFSPQAHFWMMPNKEGSIDIKEVGHIPLSMDHSTFMPLMTCFHNTDKVIKQLQNPCVVDEVNPLLTPRQKLLLRLHYKLGHIGFFSSQKSN